MESGILGFGIQNTAQRIRNPTKDWNPVTGIRNPRHGIQNPRLSWIPLHEAKCQSNQARSEKRLFSIGLCEVCSPGFGCTNKCNPEAIYILGDQGVVSRVEIKGATKVFKSFRRAFCLDPTDCPWVSEDGLYTAKSRKVALVIGIWAYRTMQ